MTAILRILSRLLGMLGGILLWVLMVAAVLAIGVGPWAVISALLDGAVR